MFGLWICKDSAHKADAWGGQKTVMGLLELELLMTLGLCVETGNWPRSYVQTICALNLRHSRPIKFLLSYNHSRGNPNHFSQFRLLTFISWNFPCKPTYAQWHISSVVYRYTPIFLGIHLCWVEVGLVSTVTLHLTWKLSIVIRYKYVCIQWPTHVISC